MVLAKCNAFINRQNSNGSLKGSSVEEEWLTRTVAIRQQGAWLKWEQTMERNVQWKDIWKWNPKRIEYGLGLGLVEWFGGSRMSSRVHLNLSSWGKVKTPACPLCYNTGTLEHITGDGIMSSSPSLRWSAKGSGRANTPTLRPGGSCLLRQGKSRPRNCSVGLLSTSWEWATVGLKSQLKIPSRITQSSLRPDIILDSEATDSSSCWSWLCPGKRGWKRHKRGPRTRSWLRTVTGMGGGPRACQLKWAVGGLRVTPSSKVYGVLGMHATWTQAGSDQSQSGRLANKHPMTPWYDTDDVSKSEHQKRYAKPSKRQRKKGKPIVWPRQLRPVGTCVPIIRFTNWLLKTVPPFKIKLLHLNKA